ncbi:hypothetical protein N665_0380s0024 [Sinapis alba]|nr:hypothetical protein N665_0380s0024 [Sinapis alba]
MFADKIRITMEVYIDDMLVKSLVAKDHIRHLSECFDTLNKYRMKLNRPSIHRIETVYDDSPSVSKTGRRRYLVSLHQSILLGSEQRSHKRRSRRTTSYFYTSKRLTEAETRYPTLERMTLVVVTSARKLRPYFQSHSIVVLTDLPLRTIFQNANQSGRLSKWVIELSEYNISYKGRPAIKAQVLADFIVEIPPDQAVELDIPVKSWILHVDGASSNKGSGIGVHLQSPIGELIEQSFRLGFSASNNEAEYEALIAGLRLPKLVGAKRLQAFRDSQLVASQHSGDYEAKNERMDAYLSVVKHLAEKLDHFELTKVPRKDNCFADALAALGSNQRGQVRRTNTIHKVENPSITLPVGKDVLAISSTLAEITTSTSRDTD